MSDIEMNWQDADDDMTEFRAARNSRREKRRKQRRRRMIARALVIAACVAVVVGLFALLNGSGFSLRRLFGGQPVSGTEGSGAMPEESGGETEDMPGLSGEETSRDAAGEATMGEVVTSSGADTSGESDTSGEFSAEETTGESETDDTKARQTLIDKADRLAAGYDYDAAIQLVREYEGYESVAELTDAIARYEDGKASTVKYSSVTQITHVFYHSLIKDTSLAFDGDEYQTRYNQVMTTIDEFNKIMQEMYDRGYVLVSIHDIAHIEIQPDGTEKMVPGEIWLPEGKIPYVLSQDDLSYYHYMDGDGFATKVVLDETGKPVCEYIEPDGTAVYGSFDMVQMVDDFVEAHPDASYRGAKGIIALTGYNGVLGYRTDPAYKTGEGLDAEQLAWLEAHPDFDFEEECAQAKAVADAMKERGWEFASHSYGHADYGAISYEALVRDATIWDQTVKPIVGETDILIYAYGADINDWHRYTGENAKFTYLKSMGFDYFCNVDGSQYWVQMGDNYLRQGRRNLDGTRMWLSITGTDRVGDLFDAKEVFDPARPTPVP